MAIVCCWCPQDFNAWEFSIEVLEHSAVRNASNAWFLEPICSYSWVNHSVLVNIMMYLNSDALVSLERSDTREVNDSDTLILLDCRLVFALISEKMQHIWIQFWHIDVYITSDQSLSSWHFFMGFPLILFFFLFFFLLDTAVLLWMQSNLTDDVIRGNQYTYRNIFRSVLLSLVDNNLVMLSIAASQPSCASISTWDIRWKH